MQISRFLALCLVTQHLHHAASHGKLAEVQKYHLEGGSISSVSHAGITPLKLATDVGDTKV